MDGMGSGGRLGGAVQPYRRDRVTWLVHWQLALWGYFLFGFEPVVPLLRTEFGLSRTVAGLHGSAISLGTILAGLAYPRLCARYGRRRTGWFGLTGMCVGLVVLCSGPHVALTLTGALLAGGFGTLLVAGSAAILSDNHGLLGAAAITETNAVCAGAGLLGPLVVGAAVAAGLGWRVALALLLIPAAIFAVRHSATAVPDGAPPHASAGPRRDRLPRAYWIAWSVVVALEGVEFSMTFWAADLLRTRVGLSAGAATAAVGAIVGGMFVGRLLGTILTQRQQVDVLLLGAVGLAGIGFALFWVSITPAAAIGALIPWPKHRDGSALPAGGLPRGGGLRRPGGCGVRSDRRRHRVRGDAGAATARRPRRRGRTAPGVPGRAGSAGAGRGGGDRSAS